MPAWVTATTAFFKRPLVIHLVMVVALVGAAMLVSSQGMQLAGSWTAAALDELVPPPRKAICGGTPDAAKVKVLLPGLEAYQASASEKQRIADQAVKAQRLECLHLDLIRNYVANYYMAVLVSMVFGGIAAIALFLVGPKGWSQSSPYLVNLLVTSGAITAFYAAFPSIFQQPAMVAANKAEALRYEALLDGMASHLATPRLVPLACLGTPPASQVRIRDQPYPPLEFIACNDQALAQANIPFALDPSKGPDYQKFLSPSQK